MADREIDNTNAQVETEITDLYHALLAAWNRRSADDYAALFTADASVVGFDGSMMNGAAAIADELHRIFADHVTAPYYGLVRAVQMLEPGVALLRAAAGMIPPGQTDLNPAVNSIQSLVAVMTPAGWRIALFQNTPAQFHGRPDLAQALTDELRRLIPRRE